MAARVRVLTIAASDSAGCAGVQADVRTVHAMGAHALTALTAVTSQSTGRVFEVFPLPARLVRGQIEAVAHDLEIDAVKIGLLPSTEIAETVAAWLDSFDPVPVVLDPVLTASSGDPLAPGDGEAFFDCLLPYASVVTPNLDELEVMTGVGVNTEGGVPTAVNGLFDRGAATVLLTGGHAPDSGRVIDTLFVRRPPSHPIYIEAARVRATHSRGTGCTHATALAVGLARGLTLSEAARLAQETVIEGLSAGYNLGSARPVLVP